MYKVEYVYSCLVVITYTVYLVTCLYVYILILLYSCIVMNVHGLTYVCYTDTYNDGIKKSGWHGMSQM